MAALVTFSGVTIKSAQVTDWQTIGAYSLNVTLRCRTGTFTDITSLQALQGHTSTERMMDGKTAIQAFGATKATLVINGTSYPNCYISEPLTWSEVPRSLPFTDWEYVVKFVQETA